jgi:hypothetical protein
MVLIIILCSMVCNVVIMADGGLPPRHVSHQANAPAKYKRDSSMLKMGTRRIQDAICLSSESSAICLNLSDPSMFNS